MLAMNCSYESTYLSINKGNVLMPSYEPNNVQIKQEFLHNNKLHHGNSLFNVQQSPSTSTSHHCNKHICAVCCDRASGKHYGVYSCEGCKGNGQLY